MAAPAAWPSVKQMGISRTTSVILSVDLDMDDIARAAFALDRMGRDDRVQEARELFAEFNRRIPLWIGFGRAGWVLQGGRELGLWAKYMIGEIQKSPYYDHEVLKTYLDGNSISGVKDGVPTGYGFEATVAAEGTNSHMGPTSYIGPRWEYNERGKSVIDDQGVQQTLLSYHDGFRPAPGWLTQTPINRHMVNADLVDVAVRQSPVTRIEIAPPPWKRDAEPTQKEIQLIQAHATIRPGRMAVAVVNVDLHQQHPVEIALPGRTARSITRHLLSGDPRDTNQDNLEVEIAVETIPPAALAKGRLTAQLEPGSLQIYVAETTPDSR